jgi:hypothetical protein
LVRVVSGIPVACIFGMYIMILVLWYVKTKEHEENEIHELAMFLLMCYNRINEFFLLLRANSYNAVNYQRTLDRVFRHAWILIVVVFVVQLAYDLVAGFYGVGAVRVIFTTIHNVILGAGSLLISILFLIYSHKLYQRLKSMSHIQKVQMKNIDRVLYKYSILLYLFIGCLMKTFVCLN